jgi:hypothetical protein
MLELTTSWFIITANNCDVRQMCATSSEQTANIVAHNFVRRKLAANILVIAKNLTNKKFLCSS